MKSSTGEQYHGIQGLQLSLGSAVDEHMATDLGKMLAKQNKGKPAGTPF